MSYRKEPSHHYMGGFLQSQLNRQVFPVVRADWLEFERTGFVRTQEYIQNIPPSYTHTTHTER